MKTAISSVFRKLIIILLPLLAAAVAPAQQWVNPHFDAHRLDFRDLGFPTQNLIPADDSFITALLTHSNGFVYGATSGREHSYLFFYNRFLNKVRPLGRIADVRGVHHALLEGSDGAIYIGTGLNVLAPVKLTKDFPVEYEGIEQQLWKDIKRPYEGYAGGRLYRYQPKTGDVRRYTNEDACPVEDLGIPVPGNSVYAVTWDRERKVIYGISYPDAHFFAFDVASRQVRDYGELLEQRVYGGPERHWRSVPRALYCDPATGHVYTSGDNGWLVRFDPAAGKFELTRMRLPGEYWEALKSIDYPVVESFTRDAAGKLYAATSDGFLMRIDLAAERTQVLGKPRVHRRTRAMATGRDGMIYLVCGETDMVSKLYRYDPVGGGGFHDLGSLAVDRSPYYAKRAYRIDAIAVGPDGTIFLGESERRGKLYLYTPGADPFPGDMNPTNPVVDRMRPDTPALIPEAL
jgi:hypothetical protein